MGFSKGGGLLDIYWSHLFQARSCGCPFAQVLDPNIFGFI